ncbi:NAD(+) diphosphatase, partial [Phytoactinopolyspora endophytica]|uniref:NAD(+) diphosphatase n=1 Tax=Phytoactinopolyspora endophytica TaxID=1642495 RepID=UPI001F0FF0DF
HRYSALAGFVEPGETPEHAVVREVAEEVGISVRSCSYAGAQPWPFPSSLMLGYYATAPGDEPAPDGDEIEEAAWFTRSELASAISGGDVLLPPPVSIARRLIEGWYGGPMPERQ